MKRKPGRKTARTKTPKAKPARSRRTANAAGKKVRKRVSKAAAAKPADALDALVTASAQALRLSLDPAWHAGVKFNLQLILRLAAVVDEFLLPDDAEPAPVFHA